MEDSAKEDSPGTFQSATRLISRSFQQLILALVFTTEGLFSLDAQVGNKTMAVDSTNRVSLSAGQEHAIKLLQQVRPAKPAPLFLLTDPNKDSDDLSVLIEIKYLQEHGFLDLRCALTTLGDREVRTTRAKFVRSVLDALDLVNATVGVGVDYPFEVKDAHGTVEVKATLGRQKDHRVFMETPLLNPLAMVESDGQKLIKKELEQVADHAALFVVNAGMADLAELLRVAPDLLKQKVARVVIMGGVEPKVDQHGFAVADKRAYNNSTHQPSADYTYARIQELGLPLFVMTKEASYAAAAPRSFYDGVAATGHPVGVYLKEQQKQSLKNLWEGIQHGHMPPALTTEWFFDTFTDVEPQSTAGKEAIQYARSHADEFDGIWKQVTKFNLYDPLSLLVATPGVADLLFESEILAGSKSGVQIIGKKSIKNATLMKDLLSGLGIESLNPPMPKKSRTGTAPGYPTRQPVAEKDAPWAQPFANYEPPEYPADVVFQNEGKWADPKDLEVLKRTFRTRTSRGEVPVSLEARGRPLNPLGRTGIQGRGLLGRWGRNQAGDPLLTRVHPETGRLQVLVIERKDSGKKALPGGMVDEGEDIAATVARELHEETGAKLNFEGAAVLFTGVVDDPRNTDNAWMETTVLHKHLTPDEQTSLTLQAGDDATAVNWLNVEQGLLSNMYASHADYVRLALAVLKHSQDPVVAQQATEVLSN